MASFKDLISQYKVERNKLMSSEVDYTFILNVSDSYANKACYAYDRRQNSSCDKDRIILYRRCINELVTAIDVMHSCRYIPNKQSLKKYLGS